MTKTLTPEKLQEIYEAAVHEEATGGDQDAGFELLCKLEDIGGIGATIRKLIDMVRAAIREAQPVAWRHDDGPITQYKSVADKWMSNGWAVTPLYTTPPAPVVNSQLTGASAVPDGVMPGGLVYSSALPEFESNDSDKVVGYHCFISGKTRSVENQEQAYADAKAVINACRAAMLAQPQIEPQNIPNNIPDGLAAAVNRLLDSDGSRGCFSAVRSYDAREEIERLLAAVPEGGNEK